MIGTHFTINSDDTVSCCELCFCIERSLVVGRCSARRGSWLLDPIDGFTWPKSMTKHAAKINTIDADIDTGLCIKYDQFYDRALL